MVTIQIDFKSNVGHIKPMHAIGQPPALGTYTEYFSYLKEANIPYSRLHDVGGPFGGNMFVDIPNIFRNFDADETDPASYDFVFTDILITALMENNCQPIYRLGVTIENFHKIKPYRTYPPKDPKKWARICEHIIRHYNEGWANGFYYDIKYWEIWNEPDNSYLISENAMWKGTMDQYLMLYSETSKHLRKCFGNSIKIGGYGSCGFYWVNKEQTVDAKVFGTDEELTDWGKRTKGFMDFFEAFISFVKNENLPFDFFSYHSYDGIKANVSMQAFVEEKMQKEGFDNVEIHLNEWNIHPTSDKRGSSLACAEALALMCAMQNMKMNMMCYYDGRIGPSVYGGLFNPITYEPFCLYYGFKAFGNLYKLGTQTGCTCDDDEVFALSASSGADNGVLVVNLGDEKEIQTNLGSDMSVFVIDEEHMFEKTNLSPERFIIKKNQVAYMTSQI